MSKADRTSASREANMIALKNATTSWCQAVEGRTALLILCIGMALGSQAFGQAQVQSSSADSQMSANAQKSEVPPAVEKELQDLRAHMAQMDAQLKGLAAFVASSPVLSVRATSAAPVEVTRTGTVSCGHCQGIQPTHKGYTPLTWAVNSVSQGDDIVLVSQNQVYRLQGDKEQLLKAMSTKARVTGRLDGNTLAVETIARAVKGEQ
jgi:hypothetical protein